MSCKYFFKGVSKKSDKLYQVFSKLAGDKGLSAIKNRDIEKQNTICIEKTKGNIIPYMLNES